MYHVVYDPGFRKIILIKSVLLTQMREKYMRLIKKLSVTQVGRGFDRLGPFDV